MDELGRGEVRGPARTHPASELGLAELVAAKRSTGTTVSVCLPAKDEAATIGAIVTALRGLAAAGLVDEVVVCDDASVDQTAARAEAAGARVVATGAVDGVRGTGKGEALWTSLAESEGDLVCWLDADIRGFSTDFVLRLVGPLLVDPGIDFVKGYYHRPFGEEPTGGGRVTELVARPILSLLLPELGGVVQPLSGEYAGRRRVLEELPFVQGWGVDIALLVDVARVVGVERIVQADLGVRHHKHRPLDQLAPQAAAVLLAVLDRSGAAGLPNAPALVRFDASHEARLEPLSLAERPPLAILAPGAEVVGVLPSAAAPDAVPGAGAALG